MNFTPSLRAWVGLLILTGPLAVWAEPVTKLADGFEFGAWVEDQYSTAGGMVDLADDVAGDATGSAKSMKITGRFTADFGAYVLNPAEALVIPGQTQSINVRHKISDPRYSLVLRFVDGWGRDKADGKNLEWGLKATAGGKWETSTFKVPANWVQPITISNVMLHNWAAKGEASEATGWLDELSVMTDLANVDPATGMLKTWTPPTHPTDKSPKQSPAAKPVMITISTPAEGNVFVNEKTSAAVKVRNWRAQPLRGVLNYSITDSTGKVLEQAEKKLQVDSIGGVNLSLRAPGYGVFKLNTTVKIDGGETEQRTLSYANLPPQPQQTEAQKLASPYGLNYHGGGQLMFLPFRRAGIVWFREYTFNYNWMQRAKGDGKYTGWPNYPKLMKAYADAGAMVLGCLMNTIQPPKIVDGKPVGELGPDQERVRNLADIVGAFPQVKYWEMDNEYDLKPENAAAEEAVNWENYERYHEKLAAIVSLIGGPGAKTVENGRAGVWPDRVAENIKSGRFAGVDVINSHHYCGTDAPEVNFLNFNTGMSRRAGRKPALFFDDLRAVTRNARADGKARSHWVTEFGWDTRAGRVVSEYEQAVYLTRAWMLMMSAGVEKAFWFYNFDGEQANAFFDGCGLFTYEHQPKPALAALAGMSSIMPNPKFIGTLSAGPGTGGYVFEQGDQLVAALFNVESDDGPAVKIDAEQLYDYLGNRIDGKGAKLTMAPVYATGLNRQSAWFKQTAYEIDTPHLEVVSSGDTIRAVLAVGNNRDSAIDSSVSLELPEGWRGESPQWRVNTPAGESRKIELPVHVSAAESAGMKTVKLVITEGTHVVKEMSLAVLVRPAVAIEVAALTGEPGPATFEVVLTNRSEQPQKGSIRLILPASWKAEKSQVAVDALAPGESRTLSMPITWSASWRPEEEAKLELDLGADRPVTAYILPGQYAIHQAGDLKMDGDLSDWPAGAAFPGWMLASTYGPADATVRFAWSAKGLYGAVTATGSKVAVDTPKSFWQSDAMELFIDTGNRKTDRGIEKGDHQFWLVPLVDENRVYVGRWKRSDEIAEIRYDLPDIQSAAKRIEGGYQMEFFIPAKHLDGYAAKAGGALGINFNLMVQGLRSSREVYWPNSKASGFGNKPGVWGTVKLAE